MASMTKAVFVFFSFSAAFFIMFSFCLGIRKLIGIATTSMYSNKQTRIALLFIWQVIFGRLHYFSSIARSRIPAPTIRKICIITIA